MSRLHLTKRRSPSTACCVALGFLLAFGSCPVGTGMAGEPRAKATAADIDALIRQLGAAGFVEREAAGQRLLASGSAAIRPLEVASRSLDREIRDRSKQILVLLRRMRRDSVLAEFRQADSARGNSQAFIPGWQEFSERYGADAIARELYAEMLQDEWDLLSELYGESGMTANASHAIARRFDQLQRLGNALYPTHRGTVLTMFTLAALYPDQMTEHGQLFSLTRHPDMQRILSGGASTVASDRALIRKIIGDWLLATNGKQLDERLCLQATLLYGMEDVAGIIAERVLKQPLSSPMSKDMAMQAIVLRNDVDAAPLIEGYLNDTTVLGSQDRKETQLRDVALAALMKLNGHDLAEIGVRTSRNRSRYVAFDYGSVGFASEEERSEALRTFHRLQAEKKAKEKEKEKSRAESDS